MNIAKILRKCPRGMKLYSPIFGEVRLDCVKDSIEYPIRCLSKDGLFPLFMGDGRFYKMYSDAECLLFPSKTQRDWNKFVVPDPELKHQFEPFEKVLVRNNDTEVWQCNIFSHIDEEGDYMCIESYWIQCIPYVGNEHLLGTTNEPELQWE